MPRPVAREHGGGQVEIPGHLHADQVRRQVEHQRSVQLAALNRCRALQERPEVQAENVDHLYAGLIGPNGAQRLEVGLAGLCRQDNELPNSCPLFPGLDKFIHHTVKRSPPQGGSSGEGPHRRVHAVLDRRRPGHPVGSRQIVGQAFYNYGIAAQRQMRPVQLGRAHRYDKSRPYPQALAYRDRSHFLQTPGALFLSHRARSWVVVVLAAIAAVAEWLRHPAPVWVWVAWACVIAAAAVLYPMTGWRRRALVETLAGLSLALTITQRQLTAIETRWPQEREHRVTAASERLGGELRAVLHRAERVAEAAANTPPDDRAAALQVLERLVPAGGPEMSAVVFDERGGPWAWAGRHRLPPRRDGDSIASRASGYYVVLEARRHSREGRAAVATVLVWAHPAVPDRGRSLAELFRGGVGGPGEITD